MVAKEVHIRSAGGGNALRAIVRSKSDAAAPDLLLQVA